jgi:uncharacterized protein (DUF1330 family)
MRRLAALISKETEMPAYIVVEVEVEDPVRYEDYKKMVPPSLAA